MIGIITRVPKPVEQDAAGNLGQRGSEEHRAGERGERSGRRVQLAHDVGRDDHVRIAEELRRHGNQRGHDDDTVRLRRSAVCWRWR